MNCDQAFDYLTSPEGRQNFELQNHLANCPRCCDVADMLGVALDLFDEAAESHRSDGAENSDAKQRSKDTGLARPVLASQPWLRSTRRQTIRKDASRIATFLILVAVFSVGIVQLGQGDVTHRASVAVSLPESCLRNSGDKNDRPQQQRESGTLIAGCVACHLDADITASLQPTQHGHAVQFVQSCVACHFDLTTSEQLSTSQTALPTFADSADVISGRRICLF